MKKATIKKRAPKAVVHERQGSEARARPSLEELRKQVTAFTTWVDEVIACWPAGMETSLERAGAKIATAADSRRETGHGISVVTIKSLLRAELAPLFHQATEREKLLTGLLKEADHLLVEHHASHLCTFHGDCPVCSKDHTEHYPENIFGRMESALKPQNNLA